MTFFVHFSLLLRLIKKEIVDWNKKYKRNKEPKRPEFIFFVLVCLAVVIIINFKNLKIFYLAVTFFWLFIYFLYTFNFIKQKNFLDKFLSEQSISIKILIPLCIPLFEDKLLLSVIKAIIILAISLIYNKRLTFKSVVITIFFVTSFAYILSVDSIIYVLITFLGLEDMLKNDPRILNVNTRSMNNKGSDNNMVRAGDEGYVPINSIIRRGPAPYVPDSSQGETTSNSGNNKPSSYITNDQIDFDQPSNVNTDRTVTRGMAKQASSENYISAGDGKARMNTIIRRGPRPGVMDSNETRQVINSNSTPLSADLEDNSNIHNSPVPTPFIPNSGKPLPTALPPIDWAQTVQRSDESYSHSGFVPQTDFSNSFSNKPFSPSTSAAPETNSVPTEQNEILINSKAYMDAFRDPVNVQVNPYNYYGNNQADGHKVAAVIERHLKKAVVINPSVSRFYVDYLQYNHPQQYQAYISGNQRTLISRKNGFDLMFNKNTMEHLKNIR